MNIYYRENYRVLILASYCGDDNPACSEAFPCSDCLAMCNVANMTGTLDVLGGFNFLRDTRDGAAF